MPALATSAASWRAPLGIRWTAPTVSFDRSLGKADQLWVERPRGNPPLDGPVHLDSLLDRNVDARLFRRRHHGLQRRVVEVALVE
jgi:hypothetical protein